MAEKRRAKKKKQKDGKKILGLSENEIQSESYFPGKSKLATDEKKSKTGYRSGTFFSKVKAKFATAEKKSKTG